MNIRPSPTTLTHPLPPSPTLSHPLPLSLSPAVTLVPSRHRVPARLPRMRAAGVGIDDAAISHRRPAKAGQELVAATLRAAPVSEDDGAGWVGGCYGSCPRPALPRGGPSGPAAAPLAARGSLPSGRKACRGPAKLSPAAGRARATVSRVAQEVAATGQV